MDSQMKKKIMHLKVIKLRFLSQIIELADKYIAKEHLAAIMDTRLQTIYIYIYIYIAHNLVNLQAGFQIDECWTPFLGKLYPGKNSGSDSYDA